jgi:hypothetical protein
MKFYFPIIQMKSIKKALVVKSTPAQMNTIKPRGTFGTFGTPFKKIAL